MFCLLMALGGKIRDVDQGFFTGGLDDEHHRQPYEVNNVYI